MEVKIGSFTFFSNFDSGNLARVERVKRDSNGEATVQPVHISSFSLQEQGNVLSAASLNSHISDFEFNLWTSPDCAGSPYENLNRTWFYFGVKGGQAGKVVKFNLMNLNKQGKLYNQGMTPLVKVLPCRNKWERIRERPFCEVSGKNKCTLSCQCGSLQVTFSEVTVHVTVTSYNIWFKNVTVTELYTDLQLRMPFFLDKNGFDIIINVYYVQFDYFCVV